MLQLLKLRYVLTFYTVKTFPELGSMFSGLREWVLFHLYLTEDPENITAPLPTTLFCVSSFLTLPLFFELLKRKKMEVLFPFFFFLLVCKPIHS